MLWSCLAKVMSWQSTAKLVLCLVFFCFALAEKLHYAQCFLDIKMGVSQSDLVNVINESRKRHQSSIDSATRSFEGKSNRPSSEYVPFVSQAHTCMCCVIKLAVNTIDISTAVI